jgi:hypothetical protein
MNTHNMARQLAFYRASAPLVMGGWKESLKKHLPDGAVDAIDEGLDSLLQSGFEVALDQIIKLVTNNKYDLSTVRSAPLDLRRAIVEQALGVSEDLAGYASEAILGTTQDTFYLIAGQFLTPKYVPQIDCCRGAGKKTYAEVLELLNTLSNTVKTQITLKCYEKSTAVGDYAKAHLVLGASESVPGNTPTKPLTQAEKRKVKFEIDRRFATIDSRSKVLQTLEREARKIPEVLLTPRGRQWYENWKRGGKWGELVIPEKTNQKQTMSTGMKWAAGLLGAATIGGVIYLMSDD